VQEKLAWADQQRKKKQSTIPSTVAEELTFNPFMRVHTAAIAKSVGLPGGSEVAVMKALRHKKNNL